MNNNQPIYDIFNTDNIEKLASYEILRLDRSGGPDIPTGRYKHIGLANGKICTYVEKQTPLRSHYPHYVIFGVVFERTSLDAVIENLHNLSIGKEAQFKFRCGKDDMYVSGQSPRMDYITYKLRNIRPLLIDGKQYHYTATDGIISNGRALLEKFREVKILLEQQGR